MERLLTPKELAAALGVKLSTIYKWTHLKKIPRAQNCRLLRFRESEVLAWLAKGPEKAQEPLSAIKAKKAGKPRVKPGKTPAIDAIVETAKAEVLSL